MAQLRAFRDRPEVFQWWLVTGSGGMGKSRLALEFCQETEKIVEAKPAEKKPGWWSALLFWRREHQVQAPPPVWTCGFVNMDGDEGPAELAGWARWQPERPTLLVVDYVAKRAKFVGQVVVALAQRRDLAHPVRLLLLEREAEGQWMQAFKAEGAHGRTDMGATCHDEPLKLDAPNDDALWTVITVMSRNKATDRDGLLKQLHGIDKQHRPLFAAFLGDAIGHEDQPGQWDRRALLEDVVARNRREFWTPQGVTTADEAWLCFATLTSGGWAEWLKSGELQRIAGFELPQLDSPGLIHRYRVMTGSDIEQIGTQSKFPPLYPDLLGEYFVLQHLNRKGDELPEVWHPRLRAVVNAAWRINPWGTAAFLDRLGTDFHQEADAFFEAPASDDLAVQQYWAMIIVNKGVRLGALGRNGEEIAAYDDLLARFGTATEPALREQVAKALLNKGITLGALGRSEEEIAACDDLLARFGTATEPALRDRVAKALFNKGFALGTLDRSEEAIAVYNDLLARFGTATEPALREPVAMALFNKGGRLGALGRSKEAVVVFNDVILRFAGANESILIEAVSRARTVLDNITAAAD